MIGISDLRTDFLVFDFPKIGKIKPAVFYKRFHLWFHKEMSVVQNTHCPLSKLVSKKDSTVRNL